MTKEIIIENKGILLRPYKLEDINEVYNNWSNDDKVFEYLRVPCHYHIDDTEKMIKRYLNDELRNDCYHWVIYDQIDRQIIGEINVEKDLFFPKTMNLSFCLAFSFWHHGIMTEVVKKVCGYLFNNNIDMIKASCNQNNYGSSQVLIKNGFDYLETVSFVSLQQDHERQSTYVLTRHKQYMMNIISELKIYLKDSRIPYFDNCQTLCKYLTNIAELGIYELITNDDKVPKSFKEAGFVFTSDVVEDNMIYYHYLITDNDNITMTSYQNNDNVIGYSIISNNEIITSRIENWIIGSLKKMKYTLATAESCTGGLLIGTLINASGASQVINGSFVTYSEEAKKTLIGVSESTIKEYSVYSKEVSIEMSQGTKKINMANIGIGVTGLAGGDVKNKDDGQFDYTIIINNDQYSYRKIVKGSRNVIRHQQVLLILLDLWHLINEKKGE